MYEIWAVKLHRNMLLINMIAYAAFDGSISTLLQWMSFFYNILQHNNDSSRSIDLKVYKKCCFAWARFRKQKVRPDVCSSFFPDRKLCSEWPRPFHITPGLISLIVSTSHSLSLLRATAISGSNAVIWLYQSRCFSGSPQRSRALFRLNGS